MKPTMVIYAPVDTFSGYGANARDKVKSIYENYKDEYKINVISCPWGNTPTGFIEQHQDEYGFLNDIIITNLQDSPDVMIWVTVPNEANPIGKYNILITAGIETTLYSPEWIDGCNRMDLVIVPSEHSKKVLLDSELQTKDQRTGLVNTHKLNKNVKVEVIHEGVNLNKYFVVDNSNITDLNLSDIKEDFCYLFVGHWMQGIIGEDRKNVGLLVQLFLHTFKDKNNAPALILKTSSASASYMDAREILFRIDKIKQTIKYNRSLPNIYVLHGDLNDSQMNELYNNNKVKCMVSLTKGEGYGRPLCEFSLVNKPIIASGWSGHIDFLNKDYTLLVGGTLNNVHQTAANNMLLKESKWFNVNHSEVIEKLLYVYNNYKKSCENVKRQSFYVKKNFSYDNMSLKIKDLFKSNLPDINKSIADSLINLPKI